MRRLSVFLITMLVVMVFAKNSYAYVGICCGKCGGNMPLNIMGGGVPETHEFRFKVSPMLMRMVGMKEGESDVDADSILGMPVMMGKQTGKYMAVPLDMSMIMVNAVAGYSFTDDLFAGAMFMWKKNDMDMRFSSMMRKMTGKDGFTMKSDGLADTMLMAKYRIYTDEPLIPTSQVSLLFGISVPTGSIDEKNDTHPLNSRRPEQLPYGMQLGSGTFDPRLGILYQGSSSPFWWGTNIVYTGRWYDNWKGYRLGDELDVDIYTMYQLRYDMVLQFQINGKVWGDISGEMNEVAEGSSGRASIGDPSSPYMTPLYDPDNYGGEKISLTTGFQWQPFNLNILEIDFSVPVHQRLNGPQLEEDYRAMVTWYFELPTKKSVRYSGKKSGQKPSKLGF